MKASLLTILSRLHPGVAFNSIGDEYDSITRTDGVDIPSLATIEAARSVVEATIEQEQQAHDNTENFKSLFPGQLVAVFETLDDDTQAKWYESGVKAGMKDALSEGKLHIAKKILERAVPTSQEETDVKTAMLNLFPE